MTNIRYVCDVEMSPHICKIYSVLLYNRFCHNLCCFVAKYVLLRFTHFCVEKILQTIAYLVKITNMGYGLLLPRVWNYDRLSDWRTWVGSRDAWRAWTRWLIYTDTRLRTTFWLFMNFTARKPAKDNLFASGQIWNVFEYKISCETLKYCASGQKPGLCAHTPIQRIMYF